MDGFPDDTQAQGVQNFVEHKMFDFLSPCLCIYQGCQIFLDTINQNGEKIPNYHKIYQNDRKICLMVGK
jgi:hypothetical protein